ncbi:MAG: hypothetical protein V4539_10040 [Bacteroidota bacterium]
MPVIFKIFLFLFLQQGGKIAKDISKPGTGELSINWETILLSRPMTLSFQSDEMSVDEIINVCTGQDMNCEVKKQMIADGVVKAELSFKNLLFSEKAKMMNRMGPFMNRVQFEWLEL